MSGTNQANKAIDFAQWVPIFPLPNAVLIPKSILPLHVFEERYRVMTRESLADSRVIAVALLKPGYEAQYNSLDAEVHDIVGVGRILKEEKLSDGRYNFLLQGLARARIVEENKERPYRRAKLEPLYSEHALPEIECACRKELRRLMSLPPLLDIAKQSHWFDFLSSCELSLSEVLDQIGSSLLKCPDDRQMFLAEPGVRERAAMLCDLFQSIQGELQMATAASGKQPRSWPPRCCEN